MTTWVKEKKWQLHKLPTREILRRNNQSRNFYVQIFMHKWSKQDLELHELCADCWLSFSIRICEESFMLESSFFWLLSRTDSTTINWEENLTLKSFLKSSKCFHSKSSEMFIKSLKNIYCQRFLEIDQQPP